MPRRLIALAIAVVLVVTGLTVASPPAPAAAATGSAIVGVQSRLCLDVEGASRAPGTRLIIWTCHGQANQRWGFTSSKELRVFDDAVCLDLRGTAARRGGRPSIAACDASAAQRWTRTTAGTIVHDPTGLCLDVTGAATARSSAVMVWTCNGGANQRWTFAGTPDTTPPTPPGAPVASGLTCTAATLSWTASSDAVGVSAYDLYHDGQLVRTVGGTTRQATVAVVEGATWGWYVNARDAAGNVSQASTTTRVTPPRCQNDTTPPSVPSNVSATASGTSVTVAWTASTDAVGVTAYDVRRDGALVTSVGGQTTFWADAGLAAGTTYRYTVAARDGAGNASAESAVASATTAAACSTPICGARVVATERDIPWGLVALPDGSVLYDRRDSDEVVRLDPATGAQTVVGVVPNASGTDGEGGSMGLAVAVDFAADPWLYVMHTTASDNRIVRIRYVGGVLDTSTTQVLLSGIPRNKYHNGGRLRFGPDGMLYAATGDAQNADWAQQLSGAGALAGKILRMTPTGALPSDNPFPGSYVWSLGHRNPQGLAFDSQGRLWEQEFGNSVMDETNLIVRGGNYGWPACQGTTGSGCGQAGFLAPRATYPTAEGSCSGIAIVADALFVACARGARLYRSVISGDSLVDTRPFFVGTYGRLRTVEPAANGDLWLATTNAGDKDSTPGNSNERIILVDVR